MYIVPKERRSNLGNIEEFLNRKRKIETGDKEAKDAIKRSNVTDEIAGTRGEKDRAGRGEE